MVTTNEKDSDSNSAVKKCGKCKRTFKDALRRFTWSYFPKRVIEKQKTYLQNNLRKSIKCSCCQCVRCLKECNGQLTEYPWIGVSSLVEYELVDIFFQIMPCKFREDFYKANESLCNYTLDSSCNHMECLETLQSLGKPKGKIKKSH